MRFVDWFIPGEYFGNEDLLRRVRLWVIIMYIFVGYSFIALFQSYMLNIPSMGIAVSIGGAIAIMMGFLLKYNVLKYKIVVHLTIASALCNFTFGLYTTGGLFSEVVSWMCILPLVALMISDRKNAFPWMFAVLGVIGVTFYLQQTGLEIRNDIPPENKLKAHYIALTAFTIILFIIILTFDNAKNKLMSKLEAEKEKSDELLLNILPEETAKELKENGKAAAKHYSQVTVLFIDINRFTQISEKLSPQALVDEINECFQEFDRITGKYHIEKIKTIGDAYMAAGGLPVPNQSNAVDVVKAAFEMRSFMLERKKDLPLGEDLGGAFEIRIGIHTGPVVAGIVGIKKFQYDIWGDTVNTASRMESSGEVGKVNISSATYELVKDQFSCEYRGKLPVKGKGEIDMYFVEKRQDIPQEYQNI